MSADEKKMVAVFNKGQRIYDTSAGKLHPKQSVTVPEAEAKVLMDYFDIVDLDKVAPKASAQMKSLETENKKLKADLAEAQKKTAEPEDVKPAKATDSGKGGKKGKK